MQEDEKAGGRLVRVPISGGPGHDIHVQGDLPIDPIPIGGNGVRPRDSWFFSLTLLDPATGKLTRVPLNYTRDLDLSTWGGDDRILAMGHPIRAHVWRLRPIH